MKENILAQIFDYYKEKNNKILGCNIKIILNSMGVDLDNIQNLGNTASFDFDNFKIVLDNIIKNHISPPIDTSQLVHIEALRSALSQKFDDDVVSYILTTTYGPHETDDLINPSMIMDCIKKIDINT